MENLITAKNELQKLNISFLLKRKNASYESLLNGTMQVVRYETEKGEPCSAIFINNQKNPRDHFRYSNVKNRETRILETIEMMKSRIQSKKEQKEKSKQIIDVKVGDLFYSSWGYEQTNINFFIVTKIVGTCSVELKEVGSEITEQTTYFSGKVKPCLSRISDTTLKGRITNNGINLSKVSSCAKYLSKTTETSEHYCSWGY